MLLSDGHGFNFDQHFGIDEAGDGDEAGCGVDLAEELGVGFGDFLPALDLSDVDARANNVLEAEAQALQRVLDVANRLNGLGVSVAGRKNFAGGVSPRRPGNVNGVAHLYGPGVSNFRFPGGSGKSFIALHSHADLLS